jgi:L-seryl-tRNA(Ser) seleniumtransferase
MPQESVRAGMGLVFFSGDKLLGGPQAGIVAGRLQLVSRLARHPLARAVRIDKMGLASLTATLVHYLHQEAESEIPVWRMISTPADAVKQRALSWQSALEVPSAIEPSRSAVGGGSLPGETLPSWSLSLPGEGLADGSEGLIERLRRNKRPIIGRIENDRVLLDPRTVLPEDEREFVAGLTAAVLT